MPDGEHIRGFLADALLIEADMTGQAREAFGIAQALHGIAPVEPQPAGQHCRDQQRIVGKPGELAGLIPAAPCLAIEKACFPECQCISVRKADAGKAR